MSLWQQFRSVLAELNPAQITLRIDRWLLNIHQPLGSVDTPCTCCRKNWPCLEWNAASERIDRHFSR